MNYDTIVAYELELDPSGALRDQHGKSFDVEAYSRFKHGSGSDAKRFGYDLGHVIAEYLRTVADGVPFAIVTDAYKQVPTAATLATRYAHDVLNYAFINQNLGEIPLVKISRLNVFGDDYSKQPEDVRKAIMQANRISIDRELVSGRHLIVVDDLKFTGFHEERIRRLLDDTNAETATFAYLVRMNPKSAPAPIDMESRMNRAAVKNLNELLPIVFGADFSLTPRVYKLILSEPDSTALRRFLIPIPVEALYEIFSGCVSDGYISVPAYAKNVHLVIEELERRGLHPPMEKF